MTKLFLDDAFLYQDTLKPIVEADLPVRTWRERQGPLFDAVKMEKNMMFLMLLLIIAVAAFNLVSSLVMVVSEKQGDIAVLQTQGMLPITIMTVFVLNGLFNGVKGAGIGLVAGVVIIAVFKFRPVRRHEQEFYHLASVASGFLSFSSKGV
jgi:lipoprotein-releasing system permease protein